MSNNSSNNNKTNETKKDDDKEMISPETSKRICNHMNGDHAVSVYAMAKQSLSGGSPGYIGQITDATIKDVNLTGCTIAVVTCKGEMCEMKKINFPFEPPLSTGSEIRSQMVAIHHQVCTPRISWLLTSPFALSVLIVVALLGYGTHIIGVASLTEMIQNRDTLNTLISALFGSAATFSKLVFWSWFLALFLHDLEALYVLYHAKVTLKLDLKAQILWYTMIAAVGFPITREFLDLLKVHQKQVKNTNKKQQ